VRILSEIDSYKHRILGRIDFKNKKNYIPIYQLLEDVLLPASITSLPASIAIEKYDHLLYGFYGNKGDILLGGGSGECAALKINVPLALEFFTNHSKGAGIYYDDFVKAFWRMDDAYSLIKEYKKIGYNENKHSYIEYWLSEHLVAFIIENYFGEFKHLIGEKHEFKQDGSICRLFTQDEALDVTWGEIVKTK
jgi:hypothetical protein